MIAKDVRNFLKQYETMLTVLAREGRHVELRNRLDDFQKMLRVWLDIAPPDAAPPDRIRFFSLVDTFGGPLEIDAHGIAKAATKSKDSETVGVVAKALNGSAFACLHRDQPRLMESFLNTLVYLYYQCVENEQLADALGGRLDEDLHSLLTTVRSRHPELDEDEVQGTGDTAALEVTLRFALSLVHAAIRFAQPRHASDFVERLFEHRKYRHGNRRRIAALQLDTDILFDCVAVVLAGWALHVLQSDQHGHSEACQGVLALALAQVPAPPVLIAEWELLRGSGVFEPAIDARLGVTRWDIRDWDRRFRVGVSEVRSGGTDWVRLGLHAALLSSRERFWGDLSVLFPSPPSRFVWDAKQERQALEALADDASLKIPEHQRQRRVDDVMQLIEQRDRGADADYLRHVLEAPLSETRIQQVSQVAIKAFNEKCAWQEALRRCGVSDKGPQMCPRRTSWGIWVGRDAFLDDGGAVSDLGEHLAEEVANHEAMKLVHLIETSADRGEELKALASLPESVRAMRRKMTDEGFKPNVLILPRESRFAGALFCRPLWEVERRGEFGEASIGTWEQLEVLQYPYTNSESILLLDTRRLIGRNELGAAAPAPRIWVDESPLNDQIEAKKAAAREALNSGDAPMPESWSIRVALRMDVLPGLGLVETSAAMALGVMNSDGGYAIIEGEDLYHRPSCPDIDAEDAKFVLHLPRDDDRKPCPTCRPDRWNAEARSGKIEGQDRT